MVTSNLTTRVRKIDHQASVMDLKGEVTGFAENALMDAYTQASSPASGAPSGSIPAIIMNFRDLEYMNSSGIGLLVTLLVRAQRQKQKLVAYGLSDHYKQIFKLTRLNEAIEIFDSEEEALAAVQKNPVK